MITIKISVIVLFLLLSANYVQADNMKCGTRIVSTGDTKVKVLLRCGEPFFKEVVGEKTRYRRFFGWIIGSSTVLVEEWTYNLGSTKFLRTLTFEGNKLVKIELGDKP
jgi:hypothetical protein